MSYKVACLLIQPDLCCRKMSDGKYAVIVRPAGWTDVEYKREVAWIVKNKNGYYDSSMAAWEGAFQHLQNNKKR